MARLAILYLLTFLCLLSRAFAIDPPRPRPRPPDEPRPDAPDFESSDASGQSAPFSKPETAENFMRLVDDILNVISAVASLLSTSKSSSCTPIPTETLSGCVPASTSSSIFDIPGSYLSATTFPSPTPPPSLNATLACQIYQTYTSQFCPTPTTTTITPSTVTVGTSISTITPNASERSTLADSFRASCVCYSSFYFVPEAFDYVAWGCARYTGAEPTLETAALDAQADEDGFCSRMGNVKAPQTAGFGLKATGAATGAAPGRVSVEGRVVQLVVMAMAMAVAGGLVGVVI